MILALALAGYVWTQEAPPSQRYRWEVLADMRTVTQAKAEAFTVQQPDGTCVIYSTMTMWEAKFLFVNPRDGLSIWSHELRHCRGERHTLETEK